MIQWFKSAWLNIRKSNGLPGNTILIPMVEQKVPETVETKKPRKPRKPRKKKETQDATNSSKTE